MTAEREMNATRIVVPITMMASVILTGVVCSFYLGGKVTSVESRLQSIEGAIDGLGADRREDRDQVRKIERDAEIGSRLQVELQKRIELVERATRK